MEGVAKHAYISPFGIYGILTMPNAEQEARNTIRIGDAGMPSPRRGTLDAIRRKIRFFIGSNDVSKKLRWGQRGNME